MRILPPHSYDVHLTITRQPNLRSEAGKPTLRLLCQILGFPPASVVTDAGLQAAKRRLSIATHPDKATDLARFGALLLAARRRLSARQHRVRTPLWHHSSHREPAAASAHQT